MKTRTFYLVAVTAVLTLGLGAAPATSRPSTFEYGVFSQTTYLQKAAASWAWQDQGHSASADSWQQIYQKLGGAEERGGFVAILNLLGRDGWELVAVTQDENPAFTERKYIFKRSVTP
jgi:hypothetical protein